MNLTLSQLYSKSSTWFDKAKKAANLRGLPHARLAKSSNYQSDQMIFSANERTSIDNDPQFAQIPLFDGLRAWAAFISFDLRKSTKRAVEIGPRDTFITMHTYLPTMLEVIKAFGGTVVGLRGDGGIAMFGVVPYEGAVTKPESIQAEFATGQACKCGTVLVQAIEKIINPVLSSGGIRADLAIGVGVDIGEFVATRIGIEQAYELTAYGDCVNRACHRADHGNNRVVVTQDVTKMFPTKSGGKTAFPKVPNQTDAYYLKYPDNYSPIS